LSVAEVAQRVMASEPLKLETPRPLGRKPGVAQRVMASEPLKHRRLDRLRELNLGCTEGDGE